MRASLTKDKSIVVWPAADGDIIPEMRVNRERTKRSRADISIHRHSWHLPPTHSKLVYLNTLNREFERTFRNRTMIGSSFRSSTSRPATSIENVRSTVFTSAVCTETYYHEYGVGSGIGQYGHADSGSPTYLSFSHDFGVRPNPRHQAELRPDTLLVLRDISDN